MEDICIFLDALVQRGCCEEYSWRGIWLMWQVTRWPTTSWYTVAQYDDDFREAFRPKTPTSDVLLLTTYATMTVCIIRMTYRPTWLWRRMFLQQTWIGYSDNVYDPNVICHGAHCPSGDLMSFIRYVIMTLYIYIYIYIYIYNVICLYN